MSAVHIVLMLALVVPGKPQQKSSTPMESIEQCLEELAEAIGTPSKAFPGGTIIAGTCIYTIAESVEN